MNPVRAYSLDELTQKNVVGLYVNEQGGLAPITNKLQASLQNLKDHFKEAFTNRPTNHASVQKAVTDLIKQEQAQKGMFATNKKLEKLGQLAGLPSSKNTKWSIWGTRTVTAALLGLSAYSLNKLFHEHKPNPEVPYTPSETNPFQTEKETNLSDHEWKNLTNHEDSPIPSYSQQNETSDKPHPYDLIPAPAPLRSKPNPTDEPLENGLQDDPQTESYSLIHAVKYLAIPVFLGIAALCLYLKGKSNRAALNKITFNERDLNYLFKDHIPNKDEETSQPETPKPNTIIQNNPDSKDKEGDQTDNSSTGGIENIVSADRSPSEPTSQSCGYDRFHHINFSGVSPFTNVTENDWAKMNSFNVGKLYSPPSTQEEYNAAYNILFNKMLTPERNKSQLKEGLNGIEDALNEVPFTDFAKYQIYTAIYCDCAPNIAFFIGNIFLANSLMKSRFSSAEKNRQLKQWKAQYEDNLIGKLPEIPKNDIKDNYNIKKNYFDLDYCIFQDEYEKAIKHVKEGNLHEKIPLLYTVSLIVIAHHHLALASGVEPPELQLDVINKFKHIINCLNELKNLETSEVSPTSSDSLPQRPLEITKSY